MNDELQFQCHTLPDIDLHKIHDPLTFLEALKAVDLDLVKLIFEKVNVNLNTPDSYDQTTTNLKPRGCHIVQSFGSSQRVSSFCYLLENIDDWKTEDFSKAKLILQVQWT